MTPTADLTQSLAELARAMEPAHDPWWIIGSAALALQGLAPLQVRDVDVLLSEEDARTILPCLGIPVRPGEADDRFRSRIFGRWIAPPLPVEFMAGLQICDAEGWSDLTISTREAIEVGHDTVFVPSRAALRDILARFDRPKDIERLVLLDGQNSSP